jgi:type I restriction enzyme M protein
MVNVPNAIEKVKSIITDYITKLMIKNVDRFTQTKSAMSILCLAKGQFEGTLFAADKLNGEIDTLYGFNAHSLEEIVNTIRDICKDKIDEILPACAEFIIGDSAINRYGEFLQPRELTELVLALVKEKGCIVLYNPFAGYASYAMGGFTEKYYGQERNTDTYELAIMRLFLNNIDYSNYLNCDSIDNWDDQGADCIVSTPPFGGHFTLEQKDLFMASSYDEFLLSKFISGETNYGFFVVPRSLCFKSGGSAFVLRKEICDRNQLEMVISLPTGIFMATGVSTSIIVLNKFRKKGDPISFVNAEKMFSVKHKKERVLKTKEILHAITTVDSNIIYRVGIDELYSNGCSFDVARYESQVLSVSEGQEIVSLGQVMSQDRGQKCDFQEELVKNVVETPNFVSNIVHFCDVQNEVLVEQPKYMFEGPHMAINLQGKIYVHKGNSSFYIGTALSHSVFKVNESAVDIEYLAYKLLESGLLEKAIGGAYIPRFNANQLLSYKIVIDVDKEKQRRIVAKTKRVFLEAERKRLGIREAGGDLTHMLGMPKDSIGNLIEMLLMSETMSKNDREWVKAINDNFRYMLRLINTVGVDFSSMSVSSHEIHIAELIRDYAVSLRHLKFANSFELIEDVSLPDNAIVDCDEDMIRVILDTAFRNAYSHGFEQRYSESNVVKLGCKAVEYDGKSYACITIANNGNPMDSTFSVEDFATSGKKAGKMGNTGKGGYHIYAIAKKYNGYINISSSNEWPFILDVLIPVHNIDNNEIPEVYGSKCI